MWSLSRALIQQVIKVALRLTLFATWCGVSGPECSGPHISASKNKKAIRLQNGWLALTNSPSA
jgi:hypothetical protein